MKEKIVEVGYGNVKKVKIGGALPLAFVGGPCAIENRDHALFIAFAPVNDPKYAISVVVEHGGSGSKAAAPIAKKVIKKVLERHELRQSFSKFKGDTI